LRETRRKYALWGEAFYPATAELAMSERELFIAALAKGDPAERSAYLDHACAGDAALRRRVERLLHIAEDAGSFLEKPASAPAGTGAYSPGEPGMSGPGGTPPANAGGSAEVAGTRIGPYKLLQEIGEGGMGTVWLAEQQEPVRRRVALKVIKAGMDSAQVVARFEAERQALALMEHPHIAKVFDGGTTAGVRPFFVMELVKGIPITRYCDEHRLTPRQRLELFVPVCQAIQHAHQKGIIHRDVKPSNVLVAPYDGQPVVKVIDFGVAKATGQRLTERTLFTGFGAVVGTLEYMSPEQAELNNQDIDTRSDVYSLGVLLYELLTGTTPLTKERLKQTPFPELLRLIREEEPPRPSTRLSSSETLPAIAAARQTEPAKLTKLLRGELDWIVMKALEKDRGRRYETANGLAHDVERYLREEPVQAGPPGAGYRLKKFVRRNKGRVAAAAAMLVLLLAGTAVSLWQAVRATYAEGKATAEQQKTQAALAQVTAEQRKTGAALAMETAAKKQTVKALDTLTADVVERLFAQQPVLGDEDKAVLRKVLGLYEGFTRQLGDTAEARELRAGGYLKVGALRARLGQYREAVEATCQARDRFAQLAAEFRDVPDHRGSLALSQNNLALQLGHLGRYAEAETACRQALALLERLVTDFPRVPDYRGVLARSYTTLGTIVSVRGKRVGPEIEAGHRRAAGLLEKLAARFPHVRQFRHDLAQSHFWRGLLLQDQGRYADAEPEFKECLTIMEKLVAETHGAARYRLDLAGAQANLGELFLHQRRYAEAESAFRKSLALAAKLVDEFPLVPEYRNCLAFCHHKLGMWLHHHGMKYAEVEASYRKALELREKLVVELPTPEYREGLAAVLRSLGMLLKELKKDAEAETAYRRALDLRQKLAAEFPEGPEYRRNVADIYSCLGVLLDKEGRFAEAEAAQRPALKLLEKLVADFPDVLAYQLDLVGSQVNIGNCLRYQREPAKALAWYERALAVLEPMYQRHDRGLTGDNIRRYLRNGLWGRAAALDDLKRPGETLKDWARAVELSPPAERPLVLQAQAGSYVNYGHFLRSEQRAKDALAWYDRALVILEPLHKEQGPKDVTTRHFLRNAHWGRAQALDMLKRHTEARTHWDRAAELSPPNERPLVRMTRAAYQARAGKAAEAVAEAEALTKDAAAPGGLLYDAACVCSLASAAIKEGKQREAYAGQALALLRRAQTAGYFKDRAKVEHLKKDTDLDVLRSREDFKKFVAELEAAAKP
jgi:serine/threonine protein kinase/tetratricopeptide (TPR) repeat protein